LIGFKEWSPAPFREAAMPGQRPTEPTTPQDIEAMRAALDLRKRGDVRLAAMLVVLAHGLRRGELIALRVGDFRLNEDVSVLHTPTLKKRGAAVTKRLVPLSSVEDAALLQRYVKQEHGTQPDAEAPLFQTSDQHWPFRRVAATAKTVSYNLAQLRKRAGISKRLTAHSWRHGFATSLLRSGADVESVRQLLGHAHLGFTQRYVHSDFATQVAAVQRLAQ
jgi:integrase/recombinase XerC